MSLRPIASKTWSEAVERAARARKLFKTFEETEKKIFEKYDDMHTRLRKTKSPWDDSERYTLMTEENLCMWEVFLRVKRMSIIVTGANSSGKSTFINKMVGHNLLPRGMGSLTKRILRITYAEEGEQCVEVYSNVRDAVALRNRKEPNESLDGEKDISAVVKKYLVSDWEQPKEQPKDDGDSVDDESQASQECESPIPSSLEVRKLTQEESKWMREVVVIRLCAPVLKSGLDFYDTPGPDLEHERDYELLRENCIELLNLLDPFSLVVFLLHNPSNPANVQEAHRLVTNTFGKYDGVKPTLLYVYNRMDLAAMKNNDSVQWIYEKHGKNSDEGNQQAFEAMKKECKKTFWESITGRKAEKENCIPADFHFEGVSMIDRSKFMQNIRKQLTAKIHSLSIRRLDSMTFLVLQYLESTIYRYTELLSSVRGYTDAEIKKRVKRADEVKSEFQNLYHEKMKEILKQLPTTMEALLNQSREAIMQDFQDKRIGSFKRSLIRNYRAAQKEVAQRVTSLTEQFVSTPCRSQLADDITNAVVAAFHTATGNFKWESNEEKEEMLRDIFELSELSSISRAKTDGFVADPSSSLGIVSSFVTAAAFTATAIASVAMAAIGAGVSTALLAIFIYKAFRPIDQTQVEDWVTKALGRVSKSFKKLNKEKRKREIEKELNESIDNLIFSKLEGNIFRFKNAEIMKSELPIVKGALQQHLRELCDVHFDVFSLLCDVGEYEVGAEVGCGSFGVVRKMVVVAEEESPGRVFKVAGITDQDEQCFINEAIGLAYMKWKRIPNTVALLGAMRVEEEQQRAIVLREYSCDLQEHLEMNPMQEWATVFDISEQIASVVERMHSHRILHRDIKANNVFLDEAGNCYLGGFGVLSFGVHSNELYGSMPLPPELERIAVNGFSTGHVDYGTGVDVWGVGVILFELIPKPKYEHAETVDELHQLVEEFRTCPEHRDILPYITVVEACLCIDASKRLPSSQLVNELQSACEAMTPSFHNLQMRKERKEKQQKEAEEREREKERETT